MLRAIICGEESLWKKFEHEYTIDDLYPDAIGLLGQIQQVNYQYLSSSVQAKVIGYRRYLWTKNQIHLQWLANFVRMLNEQNITPLVSYELGVHLMLESDDKLRPLYGLDIFVTEQEYPLTTNLLKNFQKSNKMESPKSSTTTEKYALPSKPQINVHTAFVTPSQTVHSPSAAFRTDAQEFNFNGARLARLKTSDLLLHNLLRYEHTVGTALWLTDIGAISCACDNEALNAFAQRCHEFHLATRVASIRPLLTSLAEDIQATPWSAEFEQRLSGITPQAEERLSLLIRKIRRPLGSIKRKLGRLLRSPS